MSPATCHPSKTLVACRRSLRQARGDAMRLPRRMGASFDARRDRPDQSALVGALKKRRATTPLVCCLKKPGFKTPLVCCLKKPGVVETEPGRIALRLTALR